MSDFEEGQALEDKHQLDWAPANSKDDNNDANHSGHALLATAAFGRDTSSWSHTSPQTHQHTQVQAANDE